MDYVDVMEVVSAVIRQLRGARFSGESSVMQKAIIQVEETTKNDLEQNKYFPITNDEVKKLLKNLLAAVYKMEDFAETFFLRRMHVSRMGFGRRNIFILGQMLNLKAQVDFASEMRKIVSEINDVINELGVRRQSHPHEESDDVVIGLQEDKGKMVTWLTDSNTISRPNLGFILISGQTGSGKTTLATEIYKSRKIESHFKSRAWVSASEGTISSLRSILQKITGDSTVDMQSTLTELEKKICDILHKERWLVVVDNVQSPYLFTTIPGSASSDDEGSARGSRVIMTTRNNYLTKRFMDEYSSLSYSYELKPLQGEDAWQLFLNQVRLPDNTVESDDDQKKLKSKIIDICEGIPSAIVVLGRFLSTKKCYEEWLEVLEHTITTDGNRVLSVSRILALMNSDLTFGLRPCLFYFGLFPKGHEIPVRRLLPLWVAAGLIATNNPNPEETAQKTLTYFIIKGIIEIGKLRKDGDPKTCRMPGILYDMCLLKAKDIGFLRIGQTISDDHKTAALNCRFGVRALADHGDLKNYPREKSYIQHLRSYVSFSAQRKDTPAVEIGNFLSQVISQQGFVLLRVLDLERVYKPKLPDNLGKLYQLRYLGLRWTFLDTLPDSVSELRYLETLDVKHSYIRSLPNSIWKMQYLRHLWLNETRLDMPVQKQSISLTRLQTLWGLSVDNKTAVKNGLDGLTNLKKLGLTFHLNDVKELNEWLANLKGLQSLRLRSKNENGLPSKLELQSLSGLENLTDLYLLGSLPALQDNYFPHSIVVLTLSVSHLQEDPLPILAKLPNLSILGLLANSYTGKIMVCPSEGFHMLRILKLWMLKDLKKWIVEEGGMPDLNELEIRCCHKLEELPDKLLNLSNIEKITLTNMQKQNEFLGKIPKKIQSTILETPPTLRVRCQYCQESSQDDAN